MLQVSSFKFPRHSSRQVGINWDKQVSSSRIVIILFCFFVAEIFGLGMGCNGLQAEVRTVRMRMLSEANADANGENYSVARPFLVLENGVVDGSNSENTLEFSFDDMSHEVHFYTYTVSHLNADGSGRFEPEEDVPIGSIMVYKMANASNSAAARHVGIYAGCKGGYHWMTHVGNERGPEMITVERMGYSSTREIVMEVITPPVALD